MDRSDKTKLKRKIHRITLDISIAMIRIIFYNMFILPFCINIFTYATRVYDEKESSSVILNHSGEECDFEGPSLFCSNPALEFDLQVCYFCANGTASCGNIPNNGMICRNGHVYIRGCYCATYNEQSNSIEFGQCLYNCQKKDSADIDVGYSRLPQNISELNSWMCGSLNRDSTLCGRCANTYYPMAFSYNISCVKCQQTYLNYLELGLYIFLPLTVYCIIIMMFNISIMSSVMHGFIFFCQIISVPAMLRVIALANGSNRSLIMKICSTFFTLWNLDILRGVSPNFCIHDDFWRILMLDLVIGLYPLMLVIVTHFIIILYDKRYRILVVLWEPFRKLLHCVHRYFKIKTSLIDSFATVLVLSNVKFMSACFDALALVRVYELSSSTNMPYQYRAFYDASTAPYYGKTNIIHTILTLVLFLVFSIFPIVLLLVYPFRCFQKLLNKIPVRWHALHTFADAFQGNYKDGSDHLTRDFRWFSSLFLIVRIIYFVTYVETLSPVFFIYASMITTLMVMAIILLKPFKEERDSFISAAFLTLLSLWYTGIAGTILGLATSSHFVLFFTVLCYVVTILPLILISILFLQWIKNL